MNVLDLFSGIGGFSLGLERAGMRTVAFCEIDPFCRAILRKHWPHVPVYGDVQTLSAQRLEADGIAVDVICGGFPCQDISVAGKGAGIEGERSGLWSEYARIIGELRPRFVIVENVAALLARGLDKVLGQLAEIGYDAEWHCIPASAVGAPHRRDRLWIVAYPSGDELRHEPRWWGRSCRSDPSFLGNDGEAESMANAQCRRQPSLHNGHAKPNDVGTSSALANTRRHSPERHGSSLWSVSERNWWSIEPDVGRVAHGVPYRVDRLRCLGNAVVPQVVEIIGRAIMATL